MGVALILVKHYLDISGTMLITMTPISFSGNDSDPEKC